MRTTVRLNDALMGEVKRFAAKNHRTLTAVIEDALREKLARQKDRRRTKVVRLTTVTGRGVHPGIDLDDTASLLDVMDAYREDA